MDAVCDRTQDIDQEHEDVSKSQAIKIEFNSTTGEPSLFLTSLIDILR